MSTNERPVPSSVYNAHACVAEGVAGLLQGLLIGADDGLFEMAGRCRDEDEKRRCFDCARQLRQQRVALVGAYRDMMERSRRVWALRSFRGLGNDTDWRMAMTLATRARQHFNPLLNTVKNRLSELLNCPIDDDDSLPISPTWVSYAYLQARAELGLDHDALRFLDGLFVRFVVDRLGSVYGRLPMLLARSNDAADEVADALERSAG